MPIFDFIFDHSKIIDAIFNLPEFLTARKSVYFIHSILGYCQFQSTMTRMATAILLTMLFQNFLNQFSIFMTLNQHAKNQATSSFYSRDNSNTKRLSRWTDGTS